jgi:NAD(P)-dependent dehydrogenase (short-subunit alcohol dehydrogenase family)
LVAIQALSGCNSKRKLYVLPTKFEARIMDFTGQHVVITGGSTGIGAATGSKVVQAGGKVTLIARTEASLQTTAAALGPNASYQVADVGDRAQLIAALDQAVQQNGPIDGLFLNAAFGANFAPMLGYLDETLEQALTINVRSPWWAIQHVAPAMVARGKGVILITGSLASERGMAGNAGYVISKHGLRGLAMATAAELAGTGVRCNMVVPGFIDTPMLANVPDDARAGMAARVPQGRIGSAEECANAAAFLLSDMASHITAQALATDGGLLGILTL